MADLAPETSHGADARWAPGKRSYANPSRPRPRPIRLGAGPSPSHRRLRWRMDTTSEHS